MTSSAPNMPRWAVVIYYRSTTGVVPIRYHIEELRELQDLVDCGPDWHAMDRIEIALVQNPWPTLTIEEADKRTHAQAMASMRPKRKVQ